MLGPEAGALLDLWRSDPAAWAWDVLRVRLTEQQQQVALAVVEDRRVAVASGNGLGKSFLAGLLALWFPSTRRGLVIVTAPTWTQVVDRVWREVRTVRQHARVPLGGRFVDGQARWELAPGWGAVGISTSNESAFQGSHAENQLIIFDEAQGVDDQFWTAAEGMMVAPGCHWLVIGNPLQPRGEFYRAFRRGGLWRAFHLSCLDHPNVRTGQAVVPGAVTREWCEGRLEQWGERDPRYVARVLGQFPETGADRVVPLAFLERSDRDEPLVDPPAGVHLGVDVARFGDDETVLAVVRDGELVEELRYAGKDGPEVASIVRQVAGRYGLDADDAAARVHVDVAGVGASVVDSLAEAGWDVDAVEFGAGPRGTYDELFGEGFLVANIRAELYWAARELLARRAVRVPARFAMTWEDLSEPGYRYDSRDRLVVEQKDRVKSRLGRSPDGGDAFVLALARAPSRTPGVVLL